MLQKKKKEKLKQEHAELLIGDKHLEYLRDEIVKDIDKEEISKSKEQLIIFDYVNKETNLLLQKFGIKSYDIPEKNFHMISKRLIEEITGQKTPGISYLSHRVVFLDKEFYKSLIMFVAVSFHEMLHIKSHLAIHYVERKNKKEEKSFYRTGIDVMSPVERYANNTDHIHFSGLTEAVTAKAEKDFLKKALKTLPVLEKEKNGLSPMKLSIF